MSLHKGNMFNIVFLLNIFIPIYLYSQATFSFYDAGDVTRSRIAMNPHGSGFFDFNGDDFLDVFIVSNVSVEPQVFSPHALLKNMQDGTYANITSSASLGGYYVSAQGFTAGDYDNDGDIDMAIGMGHWATLLYRNNGNETFSDVSVQAGVSHSIKGRCLTFIDYDNDGYLDLMVTGEPTAYLYHNNKDGTFTNKNAQAGLVHGGFYYEHMGLAFADIDNDGDLDFYNANRVENSLFFINNGDGTFSERTTDSGLPNDTEHGGAMFLDYNNDGWFDLFLRGKGYTASLFRNNKDSTFTDVTSSSGVGIYMANGRLQAGGGLSTADFDNDGYVDILALGHHGLDHKLLHNNGDGTFTEMAAQVGLVFNSDYYYTAPIGDYNQDGYPDIYLCSGNTTIQSTLLLNTGGNNHWLHVKLTGVESNQSGIGARLVAHIGGTIQMKQVMPGDGYKIDSFPVEFGLGSSQVVDSLIIYWPSGIVQRGLRVPADTLLALDEKEETFQFNLLSISGDILYCEGEAGIPSVQIVMTGTETGSILSDPTGHYSMMNIEGLGSITITPGKTLGEDVGAGTVSAYDASLTARNILGMETLTPDQERMADVDENGEVEMLDASLIARFAVGLPPLPGTNAGGWRFEPEYRTYFQVDDDIVGEDYTGYLLGDVSGDWTSSGTPRKSTARNEEFIHTSWDEDLTVSLSVEVGLGMMSADIWFRYDPELLQFADALTTDLSEGFQIIANEPEPGFVKLAMYGAYAIESGGEFLTLKFHDIGKPGHQTEIRWELYRLNDTLYDMDPIEVTTDIPLDNGGEPHGFDLEHNYPNPFNPETTIRYHLEESSEVKLIIFNIKARPVRTLVDSYQSAGSYQVQWDGRDERNREVPSGTYIVRLISGESVESIKMMKTK